MYFQKDYILRMIEMIGELARRIKAKLSEADARQELTQVAQQACGMPLSLLRTSDPDSLAAMLSEPQRYLAAQLLVIAEEVDARTMAEDELLPLRIQTLSLLSTIHEPDYVGPACEQASRILRENLAQLPVESLVSAAALFERGGQYALAEDAYYAAMEASAGHESLLLAFYDRLLAMDEHLLLAGGLTHEEVQEGKAALN